MKFRNNSGVAEYSIDNGTTWKKVGGIIMKCALFGETSVNATAKTINISELGLTSADDYMVLLDSDQGGSLVTKTATSFSIKREGSATVHASYQVITFV